MSGNNEVRMNKLLDFPYGSYLMVRLEYVLICGDELEAKILRLIERYTDEERSKLYRAYVNTRGNVPPEEIIDITKDIWVAIAHSTFMYDLYGLVKSENTLKRAIKSLIDKKLIFTQYEPKKRYDAPTYQLNTSLIQEEMYKVQTQKSGYQKLIPSKIDTIKNAPPQNLIPSEGQKLIPSTILGVSEFDTPSRDSNYVRDITEEEKDSVDALASHIPPSQLPVVNMAIGNSSEDDDISDAPTVKVRAMPKQPDTHSQTAFLPPTVELPRQGGRALSEDAPVPHSEGQAPTQDTGAVNPPTSASVGTPLHVSPRDESHGMQGVPSPQEDKTPTNEHKAITPDHNRIEKPPAPSKQFVNVKQIGEEKPKRGKRKPKIEADPAFQERIAKVFDAFDRLAQETSPGFTYSHTEESKKAIATMLLDRNPTMVGLERLYHKLINEPRYANGFKWSEHMTIKAVCGQYGSNPGLHATVAVAVNGPKLPPRMPTYAEQMDEEY